MEKWEDILGWFSEDPSKHDGEPDEIIYAFYDGDGYDGWAEVLFVDQGKFWFVTGSHCSCYGLEDQWSPEEFSEEYILGAIERKSHNLWKYEKEIRDAMDRHKNSIVGEANELARVQALMEKEHDIQEEARKTLEQSELRMQELIPQEKSLRDNLRRRLS